MSHKPRAQRVDEDASITAFGWQSEAWPGTSAGMSGVECGADEVAEFVVGDCGCVFGS
jgi:hypothetical protein